MEPNFAYSTKGTRKEGLEVDRKKYPKCVPCGRFYERAVICAALEMYLLVPQCGLKDQTFLRFQGEFLKKMYSDTKSAREVLSQYNHFPEAANVPAPASRAALSHFSLDSAPPRNNTEEEMIRTLSQYFSIRVKVYSQTARWIYVPTSVKEGLTAHIWKKGENQFWILHSAAWAEFVIRKTPTKPKVTTFHARDNSVKSPLMCAMDETKAKLRNVIERLRKEAPGITAAVRELRNGDRLVEDGETLASLKEAKTRLQHTWEEEKAEDDYGKPWEGLHLNPDIACINCELRVGQPVPEFQCTHRYCEECANRERTESGVCRRCMRIQIDGEELSFIGPHNSSSTNCNHCGSSDSPLQAVDCPKNHLLCSACLTFYRNFIQDECVGCLSATIAQCNWCQKMGHLLKECCNGTKFCLDCARWCFESEKCKFCEQIRTPLLDTLLNRYSRYLWPREAFIRDLCSPPPNETTFPCSSCHEILTPLSQEKCSFETVTCPFCDTVQPVPK